jgi:hypothetical protein
VSEIPKNLATFRNDNALEEVKMEENAEKDKKSE